MTGGDQQTQILIRGCDVLVRPGEERRGVDVQIADGRIRSIHEPGTRQPESAFTLEGSGLLAIPGLVNGHSHSPENCLRGIGEGLALEPWLLRMFGSSGAYAAADHYDCALAGAVEMLELGITTVVDHLWMTPPSIDAVDAAMRAYRDVGIRAAVAPLMDDHDYTEDFAVAVGLDLGEAGMSRHVPMLPAEELLSQLREAFERWHGEAAGRLQILAGPGGVQWASEELLAGLADIARDNGSGIHIHLLETTLQQRVCRQRFGHSGVRALAELDVLGPDCSLPHTVWADDDDVELIASRGAVTVHNPAANLRLGSGRAPIAALLEAGATVALGTDGSASSDNQNLWEAIRIASLKHNEADGDAWITSQSTMAMATTGGAAVVGLRDQLGTLAEGAIADLALIDRSDDGLAGAVDTTAGLALSESGRGVRHVIVDGHLVIEDGHCLTVDAKAAREALAEQAIRRSETASTPRAETLQAMEDMQRFRKSLRAMTINRKEVRGDERS